MKRLFHQGRLFRGAADLDFLIMEDNASLQGTAVDELLENKDIRRMDSPHVQTV